MAALPHCFIAPNDDLRDLSDDQLAGAAGNIEILSGFKAKLGSHQGANSIFDQIIEHARRFPAHYEDQCTAKYYFDLFNCIRDGYGEINRIVEVGVFMGGASVVLAGCAKAFSLELDLVDTSARYLQFTYERVRRCYPDADLKIRLFHGDLPHYVRDVLSVEDKVRATVQHDGAHDFNQVVLDLASLYYVQEKVRSIAIQDTHLRGYPMNFNFVDAAVYAVFGYNVNFHAIGGHATEYENLLVNPNQYNGNYFLPDTAEGMHIPLALNTFAYPHPLIPFEMFFQDPA